MNARSTDTAAEAWGAVSELFFEHGRPKIMSAGQDLMLSPPQGIVLRFLDQPRPMGELATMMRCDNSNMTGIVDRLEERGLVRRAPAEGDRRVKLIELTEEGSRIREEMARRIAEPPEVITGLSAADQKALRDILRRALDQSAK
ncbi:MAG TPA: MarR family transcriptional regulator [Solirubrobacterales bacterium]|nr:MarR family transcriptional regulator [Solirubrobacterales bacterium]